MCKSGQAFVFRFHLFGHWYGNKHDKHSLRPRDTRADPYAFFEGTCGNEKGDREIFLYWGSDRGQWAAKCYLEEQFLFNANTQQNVLEPAHSRRDAYSRRTLRMVPGTEFNREVPEEAVTERQVPPHLVDLKLDTGNGFRLAIQPPREEEESSSD